MLHLLEREGVTVIDVGEKFFVRLLLAGGFGEVKAHESDEGVDVPDGHGLHVAELRKLCSPNEGLNRLSPGSGCPTMAGTGHGWPGRAPGWCWWARIC